MALTLSQVSRSSSSSGFIYFWAAMRDKSTPRGTTSSIPPTPDPAQRCCQGHPGTGSKSSCLGVPEELLPCPAAPSVPTPTRVMLPSRTGGPLFASPLESRARGLWSPVSPSVKHVHLPHARPLSSCSSPLSFCPIAGTLRPSSCRPRPGLCCSKEPENQYGLLEQGLSQHPTPWHVTWESCHPFPLLGRSQQQ